MPDIFGSEIYDVPRQQSRCRIMVYSHITSNPDDQQYGGVIDCSADVTECATSKTIKSGGGASFSLVPRRNYLNFIYPNDFVHIYFDPGDGRGFIRTFFGFVDRVERSIATTGTGATTTSFSVTCSDFTKAFDRTNIYFNPHIADRGDFVAQFFSGIKNFNGALLRTKGVAMYGTPADVVMSLGTLLMGFATQFTIPACHPRDELLIDLSRKQRLKTAMGQLHEDYQHLWGEGQLEEKRKEVLDQAAQIRQRAADEASDPIGSFKQFGRKSGLLAPSMLELIDKKDMMEAEEVTSDRYNRARSTVAQYYSSSHSLLDMIDFSFVEHGAIDGSILSASIWQSEGTLWSIMNAWSNELVNELFCDLRLVTSDQSYDLSEGEFSRRGDEIKGNHPGLPDGSSRGVVGSGVGVRTVPAFVMREYPFATVEGIIPPGNVEVLSKKLGLVAFSGISADGKVPLFTRDVNVPGRKVANILTLNPWRVVETKGQEVAQKHLDVAAIGVQDIVQESIGRSDEDIVNLIEVYSDIGIGAHSRFFSQDVQPAANPISIARNGLRVQTVSTKYARWPTSKYKADQGGVDHHMSRFQTIRWALLLDHWYQHNGEYLNGSITTRAFPEIRIGYRLDIIERRESYYVEGTNHNWSLKDNGAVLTSAFTLSRGQRNDPFPVYVLPALEGWGGINNRGGQSRLAIYFNQKNPSAVVRSSILFGPENLDHEMLKNLTDMPSKENAWSEDEKGYLASGATNVSDQIRAQRAEEERFGENRSWDELKGDLGLGVEGFLGGGGRSPITGGKGS